MMIARRFLISATFLTTVASELLEPTVTLRYGILHGIQTSLPDADVVVNKFLGIPYAETPQRFSVATEPLPREDPIDATEFGPACIQSLGIPDGGPDPVLLGEVFNNPPPPESEDCLTINVFAPAHGPPDRGQRPVLLFIHGGGFQMGSARTANLESFAAYEDTVAVSIEYRTNVFGFPASPEIQASERNLAFLDQQLAIEWVQKHISEFGGDPRKVVIWGQSAGAMSVDTQLQAYAEHVDDRLPFRAAIMSSGQMSFGILGLRQSSQDAWTNLTNAVGCTGEEVLKCMGNVPVKALTDAMAERDIVFGPDNDNITVFSNAADRWRYGLVAKVPILTGTVADEGTALMDQNLDLTTFLDANFPLEVISSRTRETILSAYPTESYPTDFDVISAIYTDFVWLCPQGILAGWSSGNRIPTWRYYFNSSATGLLPPDLSWLGKFHGSDLFLLFADPADEGLTPQTLALSTYLRQAIAQFVRSPNEGPGWPAVGSNFAPYDVAVMGDVGNYETGGGTPIRRGWVDDICMLYSPLYPLLSTYAKIAR